MRYALEENDGGWGFVAHTGKEKVEAVFFDVDGTLTDAQGRIPDRTVSVLEYMAKRLPLYLSTALPVSHAKKRLGNVFGLFSGGVFADGGLLCYGETIECVPIANPVTAGFRVAG